MKDVRAHLNHSYSIKSRGRLRFEPKMLLDYSAKIFIMTLSIGFLCWLIFLILYFADVP